MCLGKMCEPGEGGRKRVCMAGEGEDLSISSKAVKMTQLFESHIYSSTCVNLEIGNLCNHLRYNVPLYAGFIK